MQPKAPNSLMQFRTAAHLASALLLSVVLAGCGHHNTARNHRTAPNLHGNPNGIAATPGEVSSADQDYVNAHDPIYTEEGIASWYGTPYQGRRSANGYVYDENSLSAAHRTLPMGSLVKVTCLQTGQSVVLRITDRGPFMPGRMLDMSPAAAKATGLYRLGVAQVRIDVYESPHPIDDGGRWCVQIGAFEHEGKALRLKSKLIDKFPQARVIEFSGSSGYWVRVRGAGDGKDQAMAMANRIRPTEGNAYLVRLD